MIALSEGNTISEAMIIADEDTTGNKMFEERNIFTVAASANRCVLGDLDIIVS